MAAAPEFEFAFTTIVLSEVLLDGGGSNVVTVPNDSTPTTHTGNENEADGLTGRVGALSSNDVLAPGWTPLGVRVRIGGVGNELRQLPPTR